MSLALQRGLAPSLSLLALACFAGAGCGSPVDLRLMEFERGTARCSGDAQCDDGLACNGVERCGTVSGQCVAGEPIVCAPDEVECTVDACVEPGRCVSEPDDSLCPARRSCLAGRGCVYECEEAPPGECDLARGCGCADGEGCFGDAAGVEMCSLAGEGRDDDVCDVESAGGGCAAGWQCLTLGPPGTEVHRCRRVCDEHEDCSRSGRCSVDLFGVEAMVCAQRCDVVAGSSDCPEGTGCAVVPTGAPLDAYSDCRVGGPVPRGEACAADTDCAAGLLCVSGGESGSRCLGLCRQGSDCLSGERCIYFVETVRVDGEAVRPCAPQ